MSATVEAPMRSRQQRMEALRRANEVRTYRKGLKGDLKSGGQQAAAVLNSPKTEELSMKVSDLLLAMPGVGRVKANKVLTQAKVSPSKTLGGLTERQRGELRTFLPGARVHVAAESGRSGT